MAAPVRILFYAINGTGLGHLSRLLAIARAQRDVLDSLRIASDIQFLTTSDAPEVAFDFPVYKLPSKSVATRNGLNAREFAARSKMLISNLVAGFQPDLLVLDTVAEGAFREFVLLKDYAAHCAFVYRHADLPGTQQQTHSAHLDLYDLVLVPDSPDSARHYTAPSREERLTFVGPMHGYDAAGAEDRSKLREELGADPDRLLVYVSAGGGGDRNAQREIDAVVDAVLLDERRAAVIGYGPLFRGRKRYGERIIALADAHASRLFPAMDIAVSAAGYNTYQELLAAHVPSLFYAQEKGWDRQDLRIERGTAKGWHRQLNSLDVSAVAAELDALSAPHLRSALLTSLRARPPASGHVRGAVEMLRLIASHSRRNLDPRALLAAGLARLRWPCVKSAGPTPAGIPRHGDGATPQFAAAWQNAARWCDAGTSPAEKLRAEDAAVAVWHTHADTPELLADDTRLRLGWELACWEEAAAIRSSDWNTLVRAFAQADQPASDMDKSNGLARLRACLRSLCGRMDVQGRSTFIQSALTRCTRDQLPGYLEQQLSKAG